ncbi:MAG: VanZ family protein [Candidatus Bipolaricaulis sp.]|nr:VanZ family protein [Candidatus Bipolaricaulis sp.]
MAQANREVWGRIARPVTLGYMGFLAYMSLGRAYPPALDRALATWGSTVFHFAGYALLAILFAWTLSRRGRHRPWLAIAAAFAYGGLLEVFQFLVPERVPSVLDLGVNLAGAVAGGVSLWGVACALARRRKPGQEEAGSH